MAKSMAKRIVKAWQNTTYNNIVKRLPTEWWACLFAMLFLKAYKRT